MDEKLIQATATITAALLNQHQAQARPMYVQIESISTIFQLVASQLEHGISTYDQIQRNGAEYKDNHLSNLTQNLTDWDFAP